MLINLRNALMAGKRLPYDAEMEYIGLNGGLNYISTGLKYFPDFEIDVYVPDGQRHVTITDNTSTRICERISAASPYWQVRAGSTVATTVSVYGRHTVALKSSIFYVDGEATGTLTNRDWSETLNCYLPSTNQYGYVMRYYSCKLYDQNGVLVRDFIPVRKGTVGYLYDRVSGKLFGNAGTGDFVLGPDKN